MATDGGMDGTLPSAGPAMIKYHLHGERLNERGSEIYSVVLVSLMNCGATCLVNVQTSSLSSFGRLNEIFLLRREERLGDIPHRRRPLDKHMIAIWQCIWNFQLIEIYSEGRISVSLRRRDEVGSDHRRKFEFRRCSTTRVPG